MLAVEVAGRPLDGGVGEGVVGAELDGAEELDRGRLEGGGERVREREREIERKSEVGGGGGEPFRSRRRC